MKCEIWFGYKIFLFFSFFFFWHRMVKKATMFELDS